VQVLFVWDIHHVDYRKVHCEGYMKGRKFVRVRFASQWVWRLCSSEIWHLTVWQEFTFGLEGCTTFVFRLFGGFTFLRSVSKFSCDYTKTQRDIGGKVIVLFVNFCMGCNAVYSS